MFRLRSLRTSVFGALVAATATLTMASTVLAVDFGPTQVLRATATPLTVRDASAANDNVSVVWQEETASGPRAYLRSSSDGGQTFTDPLDWNGIDPRVDTCTNGPTFVISRHATAAGHGVAVRVDYGGELLYIGGFGTPSDADVQGPDIACVGVSTTPAWTLAAAWLDASTTPARVKMRVRVFRDYFCHDCPPPGKFTLDMGPGNVDDGVSVAATNRHIFVASMLGDDLRLRRFSVSGHDSTLEVTAGPAMTIASPFEGSQPRVAASGNRVVLAYQNQDASAVVKISDDRGASFGDEVVVIEGFGGHINARVTAIDVVGSHVLLEGYLTGTEPLGSSGHLSTDGGATWSEVSSQSKGYQVGTLFGPASGRMVAESWDTAFVEGATTQRVRFHVGSI